ncbi:MAG: DEAD/DEAH box helicase [Ilumatobacteraceae bacterium]
MRPDRSSLTAHFGFPLDDFQLRALDVLDRGDSVLVAAPTGSGKTVVAEYAIDAALADGRRAVYTAPVKALSNQKYRDLVARLGADRVGLLTGDNSINGDASVVVMTTEVLRNMVYGAGRGLRDLGIVVLDEVHFLQDAYRGPVWEEVIVHLPRDVRLVCLSATVSNARELADWITTVRGPTEAVVEERRSVRLDHLFLVGDSAHGRVHLLPTIVDGRPNADAQRLDDEAVRRGRQRGPKGRQGRRRLYAPSRVDVVELLDSRRMLPAIFFIFSRNQCDEAARSVLASGIRLTDADERSRIREIAEARLEGIDPADLAVLGASQLMARLEAGIAAHHAGMVPPFKEVVEACFAEGLVKAVFATETLAVGINMPARTVVIEKLSKFTGDHHTMLTAGEYTQLTGRAGRRGIDDRGNAVVIWNPFVPFDQVSALASSRSFHLNSVFKPTYNMAANLVRAYSSEQAHRLLNLSFAQYQADRDVVRLEARLQRRQRDVEAAREQAQSPYGDLDKYRARLRGRRDVDAAAPSMPGRDDPVSLALRRLRPGDVVYAEKGTYAGRVAVLSTAHRKSGVKITALTLRRQAVTLTFDDFAVPPRALGAIALPPSYVPGRRDGEREIVQRLERVRLEAAAPPDSRAADDVPRGPHPVEDDPDLADRLAAAAQADRIAAEVDEMRVRMEGRSRSVARDFDLVLGILERWGYVEGWALTDAGTMLSRLFHECDLLIAESIRRGLLDGLAPAELAALASVFVYEHRSPEPPPAPWFPSDAVRGRSRSVARLSSELRSLEAAAGTAPHRAPDPTFAAVAYAWAAGEGFADVVAAEELSGGDFVRTTKQLIDLVRQVAIVAPETATRRAAQSAAESLFRGVVAASAEVQPPGDIEEGDG